MTIAAMTVGDALEAIAAERPTPGGGAVASLTAALAAATGRMVLSYSLGRKRLAAHHELHVEAIGELEALSARSLELAEADAEAYGRLNRLWKLDEEDPARRAEWDDAVAGAIDAPSRLVEASLEQLRLLRRLPDATNRHLRSDLAVAAILAEAAARAAAWNVSINLPLLVDDAERSRIAALVEGAVTEARETAAAIEAACAEE
jgi:glutamate formiminotransferase/formiminotetrahydrofolate cyclodeaminase